VFLDGEWINSNLAFGAAFLVAGVGVILLFAYVVRGDMRIRRSAGADALDEGAQPASRSGEPPAEEHSTG
jgi:hypothetical protein